MPPGELNNPRGKVSSKKWRVLRDISLNGLIEVEMIGVTPARVVPHFGPQNESRLQLICTLTRDKKRKTCL